MGSVLDCVVVVGRVGSDLTKYNKNGICCFSTKHATLRSKSKDWLAGNQKNKSIVCLIQSLSNLWYSRRSW
jgi:hypothetical protein